MTGSAPEPATARADGRRRRWAPPGPARADEARSRRATRAAAALALAIGVAMATMPHLAWWPSLGEPAYIADYDELVPYLGMASRAYHEHPTYLSDVFRAEDRGSIYPGVQIIPGILAARLLGAGPMRIGLFWRAGAGLLVGLGYFLVARRALGSPWWALAVASVLMADIGVALGLADRQARPARPGAGLDPARPGPLLPRAGPVPRLADRDAGPRGGLPAARPLAPRPGVGGPDARPDRPGRARPGFPLLCPRLLLDHGGPRPPDRPPPWTRGVGGPTWARAWSVA